MSASDGAVKGVTKIVDHGPDDRRFNLVILGDGYQDAELATFATDAANFTNTFKATVPYDTLWPAINVHRIDVASTDSGADEPAACGGSGTTVNTYFDATFCSGTPPLQRLLTVDAALAKSVATTQVPNVHIVMVIVNSVIYGGSGGSVAVFSKAPSAHEIGLHESAHTAYGLADEYPTLAGCGSGETGHDNYTGAEPAEPNVTANSDAATIKWKSLLTPGVGMPTTVNADCSNCDPQASPVPAATVGAFTGARYFHCGIFRAQFDCRMQTLGTAFCAVCIDAITQAVSPHMPATPRINAINPAAGDPAGGTIVTISGADFTGATAVNFGANSAVTYNVDSDSQITALSPAGTGSVNVTVIAAMGVSATGPATLFTYVATATPPQVTAVSPVTGSTAGGDTIVITGAGFTGATAVNFGAGPSPGFNIDADTQITATSPPGAAGTVDITIVTPTGSSSASIADQFAYGVPFPTVTGLNPLSGSAAGGDSVIITGTAFTGASAVNFGASAATFTVDSDTQITSQSPAGTGSIDVTVTTTSGTSATGAADVFTYSGAAAPQVSNTNPSTGSTLGGDSVVINGTGFNSASAVNFGGNAAASFTVNSDTQITAQSPAGTGAVDVTVTTPVGTSPATVADQFTYAAPAPPDVTGISPAAGSPAGGDSVVVDGTALTGAVAVSFGGISATFTVDSDTQITATSPAGTGAVDITVTTAAGTSATGISDQFTYLPAPIPVVSGLSPDNGSTLGGDSVVITGAGFTGVTDVSFGVGSPAVFSIDTDTQLTATSPPGVGVVDVTVTNGLGTSATNATDRFTYV